MYMSDLNNGIRKPKFPFILTPIDSLIKFINASAEGASDFIRIFIENTHFYSSAFRKI